MEHLKLQVVKEDLKLRKDVGRAVEGKMAGKIGRRNK
jgi:hypothetical protein